MLRKKSIFALKLREIDGPLPHNMEIRVQVGGLIGLVRLSAVDESSELPTLDDISQILKQTQEKYGKLSELPYSEIIQSVVQFQGRRRRQHSKF